MSALGRCYVRYGLAHLLINDLRGSVSAIIIGPVYTTDDVTQPDMYMN